MTNTVKLARYEQSELSASRGRDFLEGIQMSFQLQKF